MEELQWWCDCLPHANGKKLVVAAPDVVIQTDASKINRSGWGATRGLQTAGGRWTTAERQLHINALELKAATFGVQSFAKDLTRGHIVIQTDNAVTVAYINKMGGNNSRLLCSLAQDLWSWCIQRQLTVAAEYLRGALNTVADFFSRHHVDNSNWRLLPRVFQDIQQSWEAPCTFDLFASTTNQQLQWYASWRPDPGATAVDALSLDWAEVQGYAVPPFSLIGRCVQKLQRQQVPCLVLVAPLWTGQPWFPLLLQTAISPPRLLPAEPELLTDPTGQIHPLIQAGTLHLAAWMLSGNVSTVRTFQRQLARSYLPHGGGQQSGTTPQPLDSGVAGAVNRVTIPLLPL